MNDNLKAIIAAVCVGGIAYFLTGAILPALALVGPIGVAWLQTQMGLSLANDSIRGKLWDKNKKRYLRNDDTGEWQRKYKRMIGRGYLVVKRNRSVRLIEETEIFYARMKGSLMLHVGSALMLFMYATSRHAPWGLSCLYLFLALQVIVWGWEIAFLRGFPQWYLFRSTAVLQGLPLAGGIACAFVAYVSETSKHPNENFSFLMMALAGSLIFIAAAVFRTDRSVPEAINGQSLTGFVGAMVIDPPAQLPSAADFGPQSITTAPDHPAEDNLTYKPSA